MITFIYLIRTTHAALWWTCPIHPHVAMQPQFAFFFCSFNGIFRVAIIFLMRLLYCTMIIYREKWIRGGQRGNEEMVMVWLRVWERENTAVGTLIDTESCSVGALLPSMCADKHMDSKACRCWKFPHLSMSPQLCSHTPMLSIKPSPSPCHLSVHLISSISLCR